MMFKMIFQKILHYANKNSISSCKIWKFIIFWTGIYHYAVMNTKNTRWSINLRYKNLFSPYGMKGLWIF